jgi:hypothetical protein
MERRFQGHAEGACISPRRREDKDIGAQNSGFYGGGDKQPSMKENCCMYTMDHMKTVRLYFASVIHRRDYHSCNPVEV